MSPLPEIIAKLSLAGLGVWPGGAAPVLAGPIDGEVARIVREARSQQVEAAQRQALQSLRATHLPEIHALLAAGVLRATPPSTTPEVLVASDRDLLLAVTQSFGRDAVVLFVQTLDLAPGEPRRRAAALDLLSTITMAGDLPLLLEVSSEITRNDLVAGVASTLQRDPSGFRVLGNLMRGQPEWIQRALLEGIGGAPSPRGLQTLGVTLRQGGPLTDHALLQVERVARLVESDPFDDLRSRVRQLLTSPLQSTRRRAAAAAGALQDDDALERLIGLLEDEALRVRGSAHRALAAITRQGFGRDPVRWRVWLAEEDRWWVDDWPHVRDRLHAGDCASVASALNAMSVHTFFRREFVVELLPLLEDEDAGVRGLAGHALGQFDCKQAIPALIERLDDVKAPVRSAAHLALVSLTGIALSPDPEKWREWLARNG